MMDSALCLHHGALHNSSTTFRVAGLARPYSSFRVPSSLSLLSKAYTYRSLSRHTLISSPVICALNKPSPPWPNYNKDDAKKILRVVGMGTASVVLACILGVINCNYIFSPNAIACPPGGGAVLSMPKDVLDSMLKVTRHLATPDNKRSRWFTSTPQLDISDTPDKDECERFKIAVADLIKSGMCDEAENQLINLHKEKLKKEGIPAMVVDMELVLVLILQGKYEKALERDCLRDNISIFTDGRVHFYKAIILTMLGRNVAAKECWEYFIDSFDSGLSEIGENAPAGHMMSSQSKTTIKK